MIILARLVPSDVSYASHFAHLIKKIYRKIFTVLTGISAVR